MFSKIQPSPRFITYSENIVNIIVFGAKTISERMEKTPLMNGSWGQKREIRQKLTHTHTSKNQHTVLYRTFCSGFIAFPTRTEGGRGGMICLLEGGGGGGWQRGRGRGRMEEEGVILSF